MYCLLGYQDKGGEKRHTAKPNFWCPSQLAAIFKY